MNKKSCRICGSDYLMQVLNLGHHPHSDNFRKDNRLPEITYPLTLNQCQSCQFVQLGYVVSPDVLYDTDYLYESSITKTADRHWTEFVRSVLQKLNPKPQAKVLDIGSNDGALLEKFKLAGCDVKGIDPCADITKIANNKGIPTITALFSSEPFGNEKFDIITGSNVFAHIDDLHKTMKDVSSILDENGVFIFESPYIGDFIEKIEYDTIYHQHLSYLAVKPLMRLFKKYGMEIFDIEFTDIHGGCFRCYISREGKRDVQPIVKETAEKEVFSVFKLWEFAKKVEENALALMDIVVSFKKQGRKIVGISAPAKGMTLLNYTGVGKYLDFVTDISKLKQGRYTPGSHLEIKPDSALKGDEVGLLLAWNFKDEIVKNVPQIKTWIIPIPEPRVYEF